MNRYVYMQVGMEFWARWAHKALWHDSLWHMHEVLIFSLVVVFVPRVWPFDCISSYGLIWLCVWAVAVSP